MTSPDPRRRDTLALTVLLVVAGAVYLACSNSLEVGQHVDDASYVMLAQSLVSGQGYARIAYPDAPPETKYPPLLPLLIAPCLWLAHGALWAARAPALVCALAATVVLWLLLRRFLDGWTLWLTVAVTALHPLIVGYAGMAMTEAPSLLITWLAALLVVSWQGSRQPPWRWVLLGLVLGAGVLLRTDMVVVGVAAVGWLARAGRWRGAAIAAVVMALIVAPWAWRVLTTPGPGDDYLRELAASGNDPSPPSLRVVHGLTEYLGDLVPQAVGLIWGQAVEGRLAAHGLSTASAAAKWLTSLVLLAGIACWWRRWPGFIRVLFILKTIALLAWHYRYTRFLLVLLPFLELGLATGLGLWAGRNRPRRDRVAAVVLAGLLLLCLGRDALLVARPPRLQYPDVVAGGSLIRRYVPPGDTVLCAWSAKSFFIHAQRPVIDLVAPAGRPLNAADVLAQARGKAGYVLLLGNAGGPGHGDEVISHSAQLTEMDRSRGLILARIAGAAGPAD